MDKNTFSWRFAQAHLYSRANAKGGAQVVGAWPNYEALALKGPRNSNGSKDSARFAARF